MHALLPIRRGHVALCSNPKEIDRGGLKINIVHIMVTSVSKGNINTVEVFVPLDFVFRSLPCDPTQMTSPLLLSISGDCFPFPAFDKIVRKSREENI